MQYEKTLNKIMQRLSKEVPIVEIGDIFETEETLFPEASVPREEKNIIINSTEMTPPLACNKEWKMFMLKDESVLCEIYREFDRGDILKVKRIEGNKVFVENLSIEEEFRKEFSIDKVDIIKKKFNLVKRKSIGLLKSLEKLGEI
jgi:hypothetical protein